ncbi:glycine cleavage system protein H [Desulfobacterales bacterium HSG2]|nr:glycine cleavage system protein H [Desulfobacterales bacterium HSG2]
MKKKTARKKKNRVMGFQVLENECIWMKAGVVNFRTCDNAYDCNNCPFDHAMQRAMSSETDRKKPGWVELLRKNYEGASRPCRHVLTGRIDTPKICVMNYECYHCAFDQMLDEADTQLTNAPEYKEASGYRVADGYYYHIGHTWARVEHGGRIRIGFDDFVVRLFGIAQRLDTPPLGAVLEQDQVGWTFARDNHKAATLSPLSGTVVTVNHKAKDHPEIIHEDPYQEGWLFILEPKSSKKRLRSLYFGEEAVNWTEQESRRLMTLMGPEYEQLAATGGEPIDDFFGYYPEIGWDTLTRAFLRTEKV